VFVSVIVPTYNGREKIVQTVRSLCRQTYPGTRYEVVVADDGSTDGTKEAVVSLCPAFQLKYQWQANRGRCAARNLGIRQAEGDLLLFLDGDMVADSHLIEEHVSSHVHNSNVLVRGDIKLLPRLRETSLFATIALSEMEEKSRQEVDRDGFLPFTQALTGNLSIKAHDLADLGLMDEYFDRGYAWDDVDWGYRAHHLGLRLLLNPRAVSYHDDYAATDILAYCQRIRLASRTAVTNLFQKHPELEGKRPMFVDKMPIDWQADSPRLVARKIARRFASCTPSLSMMQWTIRLLEKRWPVPFLLRPLYRWMIGGYVYRGYQEGLRERGI
jgi:glycosyltransferase involved in cell wall biosynthesis